MNGFKQDFKVRDIAIFEKESFFDFFVVGEELAVLNFYFHRFLAGDVAFETLEGSLPSVPDFLTLLVSFAEGATD